MHNFKKFVIVFSLALFVFGILAVTARAQTATSSVEELEARIQKLQAEIQELDGLLKQARELRKEIKDAKKELRREVKIARGLYLGLSGDDVKELQEILANDPDVYPEKIITGFFGPLTEKAVRKFQKKYGIEQVGSVGPKTRAKLEILLPEGGGTVGIPRGILKKFDVTVTSATSSEGGATINVTTATSSDDGTGTIILCHIPPGNRENKHTITVGVPALKAHLAHGDKPGTCPTTDGGTGGGTGTTTPPADTTAPLITNTSSSDMGTTTEKVTWTTDEDADSRVWYDTVTPLSPASPTLSAFVSTLVTSHVVELSGLSTSTTYYFVAESKDASGNTATSSENSFVTAQTE